MLLPKNMLKDSMRENRGTPLVGVGLEVLSLDAFLKEDKDLPTVERAWNMAHDEARNDETRRFFFE